MDELAEYLKMGRNKLYRMAQVEGLPAAKVGNRWRINRIEITQWMKFCDLPRPAKNRKALPDD